MKFNAQITGTGLSIPQKSVSSSQLEQEHGYESGYIKQNLGVSNRYWVDDHSNTTLAAPAVERALKDANIAFGDLDLLIYASVTYDYPLPTTACFIQRELGQENSGVPCIHVNSSCLSFLSAMEMAASYIELGTHKRICIVSCEISSPSLNPKDPKTFFLFGDGAASIVLERSTGESHLSDFRFQTFSQGAFYSYVPGGGNVNHGGNPNKDLALFTFHMSGKKIMLFTLKKVRDFVGEYEKESGKKLNDYQRIIPHQASKQSLESFVHLFKVPAEKLHNILPEYGNCVAASLPMALVDAIQSGTVQRGDQLLLMGTAAGISIGAVGMVY